MQDLLEGTEQKGESGGKLRLMCCWEVLCSCREGRSQMFTAQLPRESFSACRYMNVEALSRSEVRVIVACCDSLVESACSYWSHARCCSAVAAIKRSTSTCQLQSNQPQVPFRSSCCCQERRNCAQSHFIQLSSPVI